MKYGIWHIRGAVWCHNDGNRHEFETRDDAVNFMERVWKGFPVEVRSLADDPSKFETIAAQVGKTVTEKNAVYGDSFTRSGEILAILYPDGVKPEQYTDMLAVTRIIDKLFRIATDKDALGESPYLDIAGYAVLGASRK